MKTLTVIITLIYIPLCMHSQPIYDESKVPRYQLPDPLTFENGQQLKSSDQWNTRRTEIQNLFAQHMYGTFPMENVELTFNVNEENNQALDGKAIRRQVEIILSRQGKTSSFNLLIYLPAKSSDPVPVFLGLNFRGNHTIHADPAILITNSWIEGEPPGGLDAEKRTQSRGSRSSRWPVEQILERGFGLAAAYYGDIDPDHSGHWDDGVHPLFYQGDQSRPGPGEWGAIGAWAWALSRALDYLETDPMVDSKQVMVIGHSRLGKTSLWAGATDPRFSIVISNDSGCGGAALSRRKYGETVATINKQFPHWFCQNFKQYDNQEDQLPIDQHMLIALIAPRPVYIASASEDQWADPKGEFLSGLKAKPVYELLGKDVDLPQSHPKTDMPTKTGSIGYHLRSGKHDLTSYDWQQYMDFADYQFER